MAPKKPGKTKAIQEAHAKSRAEERLGISLNNEDRRNIVKMIQQDQEGASFVARSSATRSLWKVDYQDTSMNVVYDKTRHALCSVLPQDAVEFTQTNQFTASVNNGCIECTQTPCQCPGNWEDWNK